MHREKLDSDSHRPQEDRIMRFVLLGNLSADWATRQSERTSSAKKKLKELGMTLESVNYTQGAYDFVDIVEAPDAEAMLAFSVWYAKQGFGRICTMPAFDEAALEAAADRKSTRMKPSH